MTILPIDPAASDSLEALQAFFGQCRLIARARGKPQLVSISLPVDTLDPLAVLESIFDPRERHFYLERPSADVSVTGAETALEFEASGRERFRLAQSFVDETLSESIVVGDLTAPFAGPHFFTAGSFFPETDRDEVFPALTLFMPRWQVSCVQGRSTAVANLRVTADADIRADAERVWRARGKFGQFSYREADFSETGLPTQSVVSEVGSEARYRTSVAEAVAAIRSGAFTKIVLARAKDLVTDHALHPLRVLNGLRERYPDCFAFSIGNTHGQSFIGATPERLLRISDSQLETEALAGSVRRGTSASEDAALGGALLRRSKDRGEHQVVLDSIARRLAPLGIVPEKFGEPRLRKLANVQHLHTPVRAVVPQGVPFFSVLDALHPTPAVGGSPREAAVARIRAWEAFPRGLYAGPVGWVNASGTGECVVALRSALIDGPRARIYAGAGVVSDSVPEEEWAETELKFRAMEDALLGRT